MSTARSSAEGSRSGRLVLLRCSMRARGRLGIVSLLLASAVPSCSSSSRVPEPHYADTFRRALASVSSGPIGFQLVVTSASTYAATCSGTTDLVTGRTRMFMAIEGDPRRIERIDAKGMRYTRDVPARGPAHKWLAVRPALPADTTGADVQSVMFVGASPTPLLGLAWGMDPRHLTSQTKDGSGSTTFTGQLDAGEAARSAPVSIRPELVRLAGAHPTLIDATITIDAQQRLTEFKVTAHGVRFLSPSDDVTLNFRVVAYQASPITIPDPKLVTLEDPP